MEVVDIITKNIVEELLMLEAEKYVSELIRESLSVNTKVLNFTESILREIDSQLKITEKKKVEDGVLKQTFKIESTFLNEDTKLCIFVTNYDFVDRGRFEDRYWYYKRILNSAYTTFPKDDVSIFHIMLTTCSISGGLRKELLAENLQHEIEHCFQMQQEKAILPRDNNLYLRVKTEFNSDDEVTRVIAWALYYSFAFEQDGFVNGIYQFLKQQDRLLTLLELKEECSSYRAYLQYDFLIHYINDVDKAILNDIVQSTFKMTYRKFRAVIDDGYKRFGKKVANVLKKHRLEMEKKYNIRLQDAINESQNIVYI